MSLPTDDAVEKALLFLASNEEALAQARAAHTAKKEALKVAEAIALTKAEGPSSQVRTAKARQSAGYTQALEELQQAEFDKELLTLKFKRAETVIDVWRTLQANQRRTI